MMLTDQRRDMDQHGFRALYADTFDDVWRFVRRRTHGPAEADDVTAEVYATAWRRRDDLPEEQARLWLFGAARKVLANHHREIQRRARLHLRIAARDPRHDVCDSAPDVDAQRAATVWAALAAVSEGDRELLLLRAWDGLSVADIAELLQLSAAQVSSRLHRAKTRLRRELALRDPDADGHVPGGPRMERSTR